MQTRTLGSGGLTVAAIGYGCMGRGGGRRQRGRQPVQRHGGLREGGRRVEARLALVHPVADAARTVKAVCTTLTAAMLSLGVDMTQDRPERGRPPTASQSIVSTTRRAHLDGRSTLRDLLRHPAFDGFASLILLW